MSPQLVQVLQLHYLAAATSCPKPTFFGLIPWYQYFTLNPNDGCSLNFNALSVNGANGTSTSGFLLIGIAVVDDLLRIAGMAAVAYVIYGGFRYITSQGSPDEAAKAQQTIINGLVGLVIALLAVAVVSFIGAKL